jgi:SET domain-containing protein
MISKTDLLNELIQHSYVLLKPSAVAGIGVFAIRPIPKDCRAMFSKPNKNDRWITIPRTEFNEWPAHTRLLVENYCLYDAESYFVPEQGFKAIDISLFLNHADTPNVQSIEDGNYFVTLREIAEGEELFIDYGSIVQEG